MRDILKRYGNFMGGYDADGDEIDIDEAIKLICEEIEKEENPNQNESVVFIEEFQAFEDCRQKILSLFKED